MTQEFAKCLGSGDVADNFVKDPIVNRVTFNLLASSLALMVCIFCSCNGTKTTDVDLKLSTGSSGTTTLGGVSDENHEGEVLRHAVFFSFKAESSQEEVQGVVDAFRALPSKIESIVEFQSGVNNSPEGLDDGYTHCFLLSFEDAAARDDYIPHPAHSGEFADVLRPHMDKVFVIDYWGSPYEAMESELKHAVFLKFKDDAAAEDIKKVEEAFAALPSKIDTIKHFEWGINNSPEKNDQGFTHCFMVTFDSEDGRATYLPHPEHEAFVEVLKPVLDQVRVLDFWGERP